MAEIDAFMGADVSSHGSYLLNQREMGEWKPFFIQ